MLTLHAHWRPAWAPFAAHVEQRFAEGAVTHGDRNPSADPAALLEQL